MYCAVGALPVGPPKLARSGTGKASSRRPFDKKPFGIIRNSSTASSKGRINTICIHHHYVVRRTIVQHTTMLVCTFVPSLPLQMCASYGLAEQSPRAFWPHTCSHRRRLGPMPHAPGAFLDGAMPNLDCYPSSKLTLRAARSETVAPFTSSPCASALLLHGLVVPVTAVYQLS